MTVTKEIADFIRSNVEYLNNKDLEGLYDKLEFYERKQLTYAFLSAGIDPLLYMENIPKSYASTLDMQEVKFHKRNRKIGAKAFSNCSGMWNLIIPEGIESIGVMSFYGCQDIREVSLPKSLKAIHKRAFDGCSGIAQITYAGTQEEFDNLTPRLAFNQYDWGAIPVYCSDGETVL